MISDRPTFFRRCTFALVLASVLCQALRANEPATVLASERTMPWVKILAEEFNGQHSQSPLKISNDDPKSELDKLVRGNAVAAILARPASADEVKRGRQAFKKQLIGIPVAGDAVIVFVRADNAMGALTIDQIKGVLTSHLREWSELGVTMDESPAEKAIRLHEDPRSKGPLINLHVMDDRFESVQVLSSRVVGRGHLAQQRRTYTNRPDLIRAVRADRLGIGFAGRGNVEGVTTLPVQRDADAAPVWPTPETIKDHSYPLAHYQYIYFTGQPEGLMKDFLTFILSEKGQQMIDHAGTGAGALPFNSP